MPSSGGLALSTIRTAALGVVAAVATACSAVETTSPSADAATSTARRSACSTGVPHEPGAIVPSLSYTDPLPKDECTRRCGDTSSALWASGGYDDVYFVEEAPMLSAVPAGACEVEGEACQIRAVNELFCASVNREGRLFQYVCRCSRGTWACVSRYYGGGVPHCTDAGADAGTFDATSDAAPSD